MHDFYPRIFAWVLLGITIFAVGVVAVDKGLFTWSYVAILIVLGLVIMNTINMHYLVGRTNQMHDTLMGASNVKDNPDGTTTITLESSCAGCMTTKIKSKWCYSAPSSTIRYNARNGYWRPVLHHVGGHFNCTKRGWSDNPNQVCTQYNRSLITNNNSVHKNYCSRRGRND